MRALDTLFTAEVTKLRELLYFDALQLFASMTTHFQILIASIGIVSLLLGEGESWSTLSKREENKIEIQQRYPN